MSPADQISERRHDWRRVNRVLWRASAEASERSASEAVAEPAPEAAEEAADPAVVQAVHASGALEVPGLAPGPSAAEPCARTGVQTKAWTLPGDASAEVSREKPSATHCCIASTIYRLVAPRSGEPRPFLRLRDHRSW